MGGAHTHCVNSWILDTFTQGVWVGRHWCHAYDEIDQAFLLFLPAIKNWMVEWGYCITKFEEQAYTLKTLGERAPRSPKVAYSNVIWSVLLIVSFHSAPRRAFFIFLPTLWLLSYTVHVYVPTMAPSVSQCWAGWWRGSVKWWNAWWRASPYCWFVTVQQSLYCAGFGTLSSVFCSRFLSHYLRDFWNRKV